MSRDEWEYGYDDTLDRILGQTTALLSQRGDQQAVALLLDVSSISIAQTDEVIRTVADEDWGGQPTTRNIYRRAATFDVDEHLIARYTDDVRERIATTLSYVAERNGEADVAYIQVRAALPEIEENWRDTYSARLTATTPTNQARRERDLPSYPVIDGLTFGSDEERRVYVALKGLQADFPEAENRPCAPSRCSPACRSHMVTRHHRRRTRSRRWSLKSTDHTIATTAAMQTIEIEICNGSAAASPWSV